MRARRVGAGLLGAFAGAWLSRAAFKWILDLDGTLLIALLVAGAALGAVVGLASAIEEERR